eukprot:GHVU01136307.1.p1 GENE.GHVU01136307.1~~GHVU01136307.1.p1  ORF type:complete len:668 (+),score=-0.47 GHVU01136307.1:287-2005(+)
MRSVPEYDSIASFIQKLRTRRFGSARTGTKETEVGTFYDPEEWQPRLEALLSIEIDLRHRPEYRHIGTDECVLITWSRNEHPHSVAHFHMMIKALDNFGNPNRWSYHEWADLLAEWFGIYEAQVSEGSITRADVPRLTSPIPQFMSGESGQPREEPNVLVSQATSSRTRQEDASREATSSQATSSSSRPEPELLWDNLPRRSTSRRSRRSTNRGSGSTLDTVQEGETTENTPVSSKKSENTFENFRSIISTPNLCVPNLSVHDDLVASNCSYRNSEEREVYNQAFISSFSLNTTYTCRNRRMQLTSLNRHETHFYGKDKQASRPSTFCPSFLRAVPISDRSANTPRMTEPFEANRPAGFYKHSSSSDYCSRSIGIRPVSASVFYRHQLPVLSGVNRSLTLDLRDVHAGKGKNRLNNLHANMADKAEKRGRCIPDWGTIRGDFRITTDLRKVNSKLHALEYPFPDLEEVGEYLIGAKYFASIDLCDGYTQCPLAEGSQELFSMVLGHGVFTPTRVPQGASCSVAYFQATMEKVFQPLLRKGLLVYLDDLLIYAMWSSETSPRPELAKALPKLT